MSERNPGGSAGALRVLQLVPDALPTFRVDVSVLFGKYLPRYGVQCDVVGKTSDAPPVDQGFASVRRAPTGKKWRVELSYLWLYVRAIFKARREECNVIQVRDMVTHGLIGLMCAKLKRVPFVYWMSYLMSEARIDRARTSLRNGGGLRARMVLLKGLVEYSLLYNVVLRFADHVFVQTDTMLERVEQKGIPRSKMTPVPMGVDMEAVMARPEPRRPDGWETGPLLAYLGALDPVRQIDVIIDALVLIRQVQPDVRLLLIGDGSAKGDAQRLLDHAAKVGVGDAVRITGWLPIQEAWQLLVGADAAVSYVPRGRILDTGSPTKVLEYMALGIPSLGNDNPDQRVVMQEADAGWLTDSTPAGLADAAIRILADPQSAARRAAAGPAYIEAKRSYRVLAEMVAQRYKVLVAQQ